ncbi:MAG: hypothetical protein AAF401_05330, partial [Pseudomonadota bacterium]
AQGLPRNFYGWWGSMPFEGHVWSLATRSKRGKVEIIFHDPIRPSDFADRKLLTQHCEQAVRSALPAELLDGSLSPAQRRV